MQTNMLDPTLFGRLQPGQGVLGLRSEFDRLFDQFLGPAGRVFGVAAWTPPMNLWEDADDLVLEAELPGLSLEDIDLTLEREQLTIRGNRPETFASSNGESQAQGRQQGQMQRQLQGEAQNPSQGQRPNGGQGQSQRAEAQRPDVNWLHRERPSGRFERTVTLPLPVDVESVEARLEHGVLTVRLPKAQSVRARKIQVQKA
jgi:HSP20 family protein